MAAALILATADTAANSADVVVSAGTPLTVALKGIASAAALVLILIKDDAGTYQQVGELSAANRITVINAPGTYRFQRIAGSACGVFSA
jgi:hypothetical protein